VASTIEIVDPDQDNPYYAKLSPASPEELKALEDSLALIEEQARAGADLDELERAISQAHSNYIYLTPGFEAGTLVYRAVHVSEKPHYQSRISYPPSEYVKRCGRLNVVGETVFYGSLGAPANCFFECRAQVGNLFAVGTWQTTKLLYWDHFGYSQEAFRSLPSERMAPWQQYGIRESRTNLLRNWQAKVFTALVNDLQEDHYRLGIALSRWALNSKSKIPLAGLVYPSVAGKLSGDNIMIFPHVVDSSLELRRVDLVRVVSIDTLETVKSATLGDIIGEVKARHLDSSFEHRRDGRLIWNRESTAMSITPWRR
jgi:hypothetical protein